MNASAAASSRVDRGLPWVAAVLALAPFVWCSGRFAELWWFGDDWDLLNEIALRDYWRWIFQPFSESFVPLFKLLWSGVVFAGAGSYFPLVCALWATHALNVFLLARLLRRTGFGRASTALVAGVLALAAINLETLGWSVQWSALLAMTFLLAAVDWHARQRPELSTWNWRTQGVLAVLIAASALTFARGVLTGIVLALVSLAPIDEPWDRWLPRLRTAAVCLAPAAAVIAMIYLFSPGNHHRLGDKWVVPAIKYGYWYWGTSPFRRLLEVETWGERTTLMLAALKVAAIVAGFRCARGPQRRLLALLLLLDLGNAALLGLGRHEFELITANSSRYQYHALLCTLPFVGCVFEALLQRLPSASWRTTVTTAAVALAAFAVARPWPHEVEAWVEWRGRATRAALLPAPERGTEEPATSIEFVPIPPKRARELIVQYHLH